jgi:hypothetical protein
MKKALHFAADIKIFMLEKAPELFEKKEDDS